MPAPDPDYLERNRRAWTDAATDYATWAPDAWSRQDIDWGVWNIPDREVGAMGDVDGLDAVELGCGTSYISAWLARHGASPVGIDLTPAQLATALAMQDRFGLRFPLVEGNAERLPFRDRAFDLAVSEYGASLWCDPYLWVPEASRVLRPGGRLVFLSNAPLATICTPDEGPAIDRLVRDYFGMHRLDWADTNEVEFHLTHGDWVRLLRSNGFEIEDLVELQAPEGATTRFSEYVTSEWAHRWPSEEIWVTRRR